MGVGVATITWVSPKAWPSLRFVRLAIPSDVATIAGMVAAVKRRHLHLTPSTRLVHLNRRTLQWAVVNPTGVRLRAATGIDLGLKASTEPIEGTRFESGAVHGVGKEGSGPHPMPWGEVLELATVAVACSVGMRTTS